MSTVTSFDSLDPDLVAQATAELTQLMQEKYPQIELERGVVQDILMRLSAMHAAVNQTDAQTWLQSSSLLEINNNPTIADDTQVDRVLSNWGVARQPGTVATGNIVIVADSDVTVVIPAGLVFSAGGAQFTPTQAFTGRPAGSLLQSAADCPMTALGNGQFSFAIAATCTAVGAVGNIPLGTKLTLSATPSHVVAAYAESAFLGGYDTELNAALLQRLVMGIAAKGAGNRVTQEALIKSQADFSRTLDVSIIGYGDEEMTRDQHWILPLSGGGRTDLYIRTNEQPTAVALTKTATLVDSTAQGGIWQFEVQRDDSPGFYQVSAINQLTASLDDPGYAVLSDIRGADLSGDAWVPDISYTSEAVYTAFQTAVIRFLDTDTPVLGLTLSSSTRDYSVILLGLPQIADLQTFCSSRQIRNYAGDVLVRAPIPCFLSINFNIHLPPTEPTPDTAAIATALAGLVNNLGYSGRLYAATLAGVINEHLTGQSAVGEMDMLGSIRRPDGISVRIRSGDVLVIPHDPLHLVTGRTTLFVLDPGDVGISIVQGGFPQL